VDVLRAGLVVLLAAVVSASTVVPPLTFAVALVLIYGVLAPRWARAEPVRVEHRPAAARRDEGPAPLVSRGLRAANATWLLFLAMVSPVLGIGPGSSCEGCASVWVGLWFTWVGFAVCAAVYAWSLRPNASPRFAREAALRLIPVTFVVLVAGMTIAGSGG
jgi:hypothetical protein